jgi:site-specific DNA-methyltransferase (adenine-specific)
VTPARKPSFYSDATDRWRLIEADALLALTQLPGNSVDAVVVDPPYNLSLAGNDWDGYAIRQVVSDTGERLSPNEAFARWTRVWATEARRVLRPGGHVVAFGAPRTVHSLTRGVEDAGLEIRDQLMWLYAQGMPKSRRLPGGLGTGLKPAYEPILLARAPLEGTTPRNLDAWGTGALNIDASRVDGRWPPHVVLSHAESCTRARCAPACPVGILDRRREGLSRMFFCAKATRAEREAGCEQLPKRPVQFYTGKHHPPKQRHNLHPTVKPIYLMRWLVALVTPPGGTVLDPFAGSGSSGAAALVEGRRFLGIEREPQYIDIACARLTHWAHQTRERS